MSTAPADSTIQIRGLTKSYSGVQVLRGVDLDVARGSICALLGSNGAGKTTTVRILSTLLAADSGTARVNGFDVATGAAQVRSSISLTGQFAAVDEILTGRENLVLIARLRHLADPGAVADALLAQFSLTEAATRKVSTYSGGMRRRLDLAMSLAGDPAVLFLDEPTTGLDPHSRANLWQHISAMRARYGMTLVLTTHYLDEADSMAERVIVIDHGTIIADDTPDALKRDHADDVITLDVNTTDPGPVRGALPAFDVNIQTHGNERLRLEIRSYRGSDRLPEIIETLRLAGLTVTSADLNRASLDDVFLNLTGRSLREDAA